MKPDDNVQIRRLYADEILEEVKPLIGKIATHVAIVPGDGAGLLVLFSNERTALQITRLPQNAFQTTALVVKVGHWKGDLGSLIPALDLIDEVCGRTFTGMERELFCFGEIAVDVKIDGVELLPKRKPN